MSKIITVVFLCASILLTGCQPANNESNKEATATKDAQKPQPKEPETFVDFVQRSHKFDLFNKNEAIQFDIVLGFGGKTRLDATMTLSTDSQKGKIVMKDGTQLIYDGDSNYYSKSIENPQRVRFSTYTWPYFFMFPYKLNDPGTIWTDYADKEMNGKKYDVQKLSFEAGIGDDPGDWYVVYADPKTKLVDVAAYIVTAGKTQDEAEKDPHAIKYESYQTVDGVPIATKWSFWGWRAEEDLTDQLGNASLTNIKFVDVAADFYKPCDDMIKDK